MRAFSDNIIFLDTEFTNLDPVTGELLSIALVKTTGEELYLEFSYRGKASEWVEKNVLPYLLQEKVSPGFAAEKIREFIGRDRSYLVAFVNDYDMMYFYRLFGADERPAHWLPVDFASILWGDGVDPESYSRNGRELARSLGIDVEKYSHHNALDDARLLKEVYYAYLKVRE